MKAGKTNIEINTPIETTKNFNNDVILYGRIWNPFGNSLEQGVVAGIYIDEQCQDKGFGDIANLKKNDFKVIK